MTDDGARRWRRVGQAPLTGPIDFVNRADGWGVAAPGATTKPLDQIGPLYRTIDGGRNWQRSAIYSGASRDTPATICGTPHIFGSRDESSGEVSLWASGPAGVLMRGFGMARRR